MLTLLGSLLGFGTSFLPKVMDFFQDKQDKAHELAVMDKQIEAQKQTAVQKLAAVNVEADIREIESLHRHDKASGVRWIDGLRGSVRPVITYTFMGLFVFVEVSAYWALIDTGVAASDALQIVWDDRIMALWSAILAFWFGSRSIQKSRGRN